MGGVDGYEEPGIRHMSGNAECAAEYRSLELRQGRFYSSRGSALHRAGMAGARKEERRVLLSLWELLDSARTGVHPQPTAKSLLMRFSPSGVPAFRPLPLSKANPESPL